MSLVVDTVHSKKHRISTFSSADSQIFINKGWSFSYVYSFLELRDVFVALSQSPFETLSQFYRYCTSINLPFAKTKWSERRILEQLNALRNFGLIDDGFKVRRRVFFSSIGEALTEQDVTVFREVYFTYFRFKEIFSWFVDIQKSSDFQFVQHLEEGEIIRSSNPVFAFANKSRFIDTIFFSLIPNPELFVIQLEHEDLMRFWDVFVKWGLELNILEKFNLKNLGIRTIEGQNISCVFLLTELESFDLLDFINTRWQAKTYIYIPELVLDIVLNYRIKVDQAKQLILEQYKKYKEKLSFERTSEIFIKKQEIRDGEKIFFPKHNDSYVSHLIVRR
jgi:hypothetical protein